MNGVEILSSETIYHPILPWWCGLIAFVAVCIFTMLFVNYCANGKIIPICLSLFMLINSAMIIYLALSSDKTNIDYIKHKATINDSVSMNEFMDKYEILDQEDKIYTVKEKTQ